jgi:hypothetical protein
MKDLFDQVCDEYGDDCILVFRSRTGDYITMSRNVPRDTCDILLELAHRMDKGLKGEGSKES